MSAPIVSPPVSMCLPTAPPDQFDVSRQTALVPPFQETAGDSYFNAFKHIAATLKWPKTVWSLLLQCKLWRRHKRCVRVYPPVRVWIVRATMLRVYESVLEAYRQKFCACKKSINQMYVEFACEKSVLLDKWCEPDQFGELILLEEFKKCLPEKIVLYLNEQKVDPTPPRAVC